MASGGMASARTVEVPIKGIDCAECTVRVREAISTLPGVESVDVFLASEKALVRLDPARVDLKAIARAVEEAGYSVPSLVDVPPAALPASDFTRRVLTLFGVVFGTVLFVVVAGEWLGLFEAATERVP